MNDRRTFFRDLTSNVINGAKKAVEAKKSVDKEVAGVLGAVAGVTDELDRFDADFFDSYEMSYSMTLAYPREFFDQMAEAAEIPHEGVETLALVKALHEKGVI